MRLEADPSFAGLNLYLAKAQTIAAWRVVGRWLDSHVAGIGDASGP